MPTHHPYIAKINTEIGGSRFAMLATRLSVGLDVVRHALSRRMAGILFWRGLVVLERSFFKKSNNNWRP